MCYLDRTYHVLPTAHCLYMAGRSREAYNQAGRAAQVSRPRAVVHWRLLVRLERAILPARKSLQTIIAGLSQFPADDELLFQLEQVCEETGLWPEIRQWAIAIVTRGRLIHQTSRAVRVVCAAAAHLRDESLALACSRLIANRPELMGGPFEPLRAYAGVALAFDRRPDSSETVDALTRDVRCKTTEYRLHLLNLWAGMESGRLNWAPPAIDRLQLGRPSIPIGRGWSQLAYWLALRLRAANAPPECAAAILRLHLKGDEFLSAFLHAYGLASMGQAQQAAERGDMKAALHGLCAALGAWAAFLQREGPIACFLKSRLAKYGPGVEHLQPVRAGELGAVMLEMLADRTADRCGIDAERLKLMWELETKAAKGVGRLGGIPVGSDRDALVAGPFLVSELQLQAAVARLLSERKAPDALSESMKLLAQLLGLEIDLDSDTEADKAAQSVERLFSPLGPAQVLLDRHQFEAARRELNGGRITLDLLSEALYSFIPDKQGQSWLRTGRSQLEAECVLSHSKDAVAQVPINLDLVRRLWTDGVQAGEGAGTGEEIRRYIGEIAIGRAAALFMRRSREERIADRIDPRPEGGRRLEAIELLSIAWDITRSAGVQGPLTEYLNIHAVALANKDRLTEAIDLLRAALAVKPNARLGAENLSRMVIAQLRLEHPKGRDRAGEFLLEQIRYLRSLERQMPAGEIQRCLEDLADKGSTPFFNTCFEAVEANDFTEAVEQMIWCLRIAPQDANVARGSLMLALQLQVKASAGDRQCRQSLDRLLRHLPRGAVRPMIA